MRGKILVIDDDEEMLQLIQHILREYEVITALSGLCGLEKFDQAQPDLVILDIMMPQIDGWEVCQRIREVSAVPIIILSALRWHKNVVRGLEAGADDYIAKPFHSEEVRARVEAMLRRIQMPPPASHDSPLRFGNDLVIDPEDRQVMVRGEIVSLTPTEFELISFFAKHAGRILTPHVIYDNLWPYDTHVNLDRVKWYISRLRKKIEDDPRHPRYILTEHGLGYRLVP